MVIQFDTTQVAAVLAFAAGAGSAGAWLWARVVRPVRRLTARAEEFWEDWNGQPDRPGVPGRPGVMLRLAGMEARDTGFESRLTAIETGLGTNGASLRATVNRTELAIAEITKQMTEATVIALHTAPNTAKG